MANRRRGIRGRRWTGRNGYTAAGPVTVTYAADRAEQVLSGELEPRTEQPYSSAQLDRVIAPPQAHNDRPPGPWWHGYRRG